MHIPRSQSHELWERTNADIVVLICRPEHDVVTEYYSPGIWNDPDASRHMGSLTHTFENMLEVRCAVLTAKLHERHHRAANLPAPVRNLDVLPDAISQTFTRMNLSMGKRRMIERIWFSFVEHRSHHELTEELSAVAITEQDRATFHDLFLLELVLHR